MADQEIVLIKIHFWSPGKGFSKGWSVKLHIFYQMKNICAKIFRVAVVLTKFITAQVAVSHFTKSRWHMIIQGFTTSWLIEARARGFNGIICGFMHKIANKEDLCQKFDDDIKIVKFGTAWFAGCRVSTQNAKAKFDTENLWELAWMLVRI